MTQIIARIGDGQATASRVIAGRVPDFRMAGERGGEIAARDLSYLGVTKNEEIIAANRKARAGLSVDARAKLDERLVSAYYMCGGSGFGTPSTETLLLRGADVNAIDVQGATALMYACEFGQDGFARKLLEWGAGPNAGKTKSGETALILAARTGNWDIVKMLVANGADVNGNDVHTTALVCAAERGRPEIVELLVARGAEVNARTGDGKTALGEVLEQLRISHWTAPGLERLRNVERILREHGATE